MGPGAAASPASRGIQTSITRGQALSASAGVPRRTVGAVAALLLTLTDDAAVAAAARHSPIRGLDRPRVGTRVAHHHARSARYIACVSPGALCTRRTRREALLIDGIASVVPAVLGHAGHARPSSIASVRGQQRITSAGGRAACGPLIRIAALIRKPRTGPLAGWRTRTGRPRRDGSGARNEATRAQLPRSIAALTLPLARLVATHTVGAIRTHAIARLAACGPHRQLLDAGAAQTLLIGLHAIRRSRARTRALARTRARTHACVHRIRETLHFSAGTRQRGRLGIAAALAVADHPDGVVQNAASGTASGPRWVKRTLGGGPGTLPRLCTARWRVCAAIAVWVRSGTDWPAGSVVFGGLLPLRSAALTHSSARHVAAHPVRTEAGIAFRGQSAGRADGARRLRWRRQQHITSQQSASDTREDAQRARGPFYSWQQRKPRVGAVCLRVMTSAWAHSNCWAEDP